MSRQSGFTLVELMVVVGIIAILSAVATPAYINYQNRAKQTEAYEGVLRAKMDQQAFWADNSRYANTIGCLYSFGNACANTFFLTSSNGTNSYRITIAGTGNARQIQARRWISVGSTNDRVTLAAGNTTPDTVQPVVANPAALKFSIFSWIFD